MFAISLRSRWQKAALSELSSFPIIFVFFLLKNGATSTSLNRKIIQEIEAKLGIDECCFSFMRQLKLGLMLSVIQNKKELDESVDSLLFCTIIKHNKTIY